VTPPTEPVPADSASIGSASAESAPSGSSASETVPSGSITALSMLAAAGAPPAVGAGGNDAVRAPVELSAEEREILAEDVPVFGRTLKDPASRERYARLADALATGSVPAELVPSLEAMLELMLQTKSVRRRHGPDEERLLTDLFFRTGRGAGLRSAARDVTRALEALKGQTIGRIRVTAAPGQHTIAIETDRAHLTLALDGSGARVERVEVGG